MEPNDIEDLASGLARKFRHVTDEEPIYGSDLIELIRAVVRDEIGKAVERQEVTAKLATQQSWDSDEFHQRVKALSEGRPTVTPLSEVRPCCKPQGAVLHVCHLYTGKCCYSNAEVCPNHG